MIDFYARRDELRPGQVFRDQDGCIVRLDRAVPGDGTDWYVQEWDNGWFVYDRRIHPCDLAERIDDPSPPVTTTCIEHAYGSTTRLSFQIKVF
jgi:hypothetical protein